MNKKSIFESTRRFVVFSYSVGHGLLLLRSGKTKDNPTRIDVLLQDVRAMQIRAWFDGIAIDEVDSHQLNGFRSNPLDMLQPGSKVYYFRGAGWEGNVVGGILSSKEDDGEYMAPSGLC